MQLKYGLAEESYKYQYGIETHPNHDFLFKKNISSLVTAKRDWAAFQVLLEGEEKFTLSVGQSPVFSPHGPLENVRLSAAVEGFPEMRVKLYPIGLIQDDDGIFKADLLLHDEAVLVEKGKIQPVWVEIEIPEEMASGIYKGKIRLFTHSMFEDEKVADELEFEIQVKDVLLPAPAGHSFHLDLWQHLSNISRKHEVPLWSDEHFRVLEEYVKSLGELGQKAITIIASEIPWSGQRCFRVKNYPSDQFEYSMAKVEKDRSGRFVYDFSVMERYIRLCFQYGIDREIEVFGLANIWTSEEEGYGSVAPDYPDAIRIRYLDRADNSYKYMKSAAEIKEYIKALETFFLEKDWMDRVLVVADEPADVEMYRVRLRLLSETAPSFAFKTAINHAEFIGEFQDRVKDFVPVLPAVCEEWELLNRLRGTIRGRLLWYVCCWPPLPNTFISSPLLESRLIGILTAYMSLDGFLRWNYTVWPENPRERISYKFPNWKAGDTNFVYPARDGRPLLTLRYKNLKRGIEDFELIHMLKTVHPNPESVLEQVWDRVLRTKDIQDFHPGKGKKPNELYSLDESDYQAAKTLLLDEISRFHNMD